MTIESNPLPGSGMQWRVICDTPCGDVEILDVDPDAPFSEVVQAVRDLGWKINPPDSYKLPREGHEGLTRKATHKVWTHTCPDCRQEQTMSLNDVMQITNAQHPNVITESRPFKLGVAAAKAGEPRDSNPCWGPNTRPKWYAGWDSINGG